MAQAAVDVPVAQRLGGFSGQSVLAGGEAVPQAIVQNIQAKGAFRGVYFDSALLGRALEEFPHDGGNAAACTPDRAGEFGVVTARIEEGLSLIEQNADAILRDVGMEVRNDPDALRYYREAGADVQGSHVRFEPGLCRQIITDSAPREFIQHARNPDNNVVIGGGNTVLAPSWPPRSCMTSTVAGVMPSSTIFTNW